MLIKLFVCAALMKDRLYFSDCDAFCYAVVRSRDLQAALSAFSTSGS